jgi:multiple sugar transport system permease protein
MQASVPRPETAGAGRRRARRAETAQAWLFLAPSAAILGLFGFLPLLGALVLSFQQWRLKPEGWIGVQNYVQALFAPPEASRFWHSLLITLYYVIGTVPPTIILGYLLAELLHARIRGLAFYRSLFFFPYIVSPVAAAAVWQWILNPSFGVATAAAARFGMHPRWLHEEAGVLELLGRALSLDLPSWAGGPSLALVCIIGVSVWHGLGFAVVILLAGLAAIPEGSIEAARLDGARGWSLMRAVKLPLLSPTLFFLLVVFTIRAFQTFTQIYILSPDNAGGPNGATRNITLYIVESFYTNQPRLGPGYGAAVAMLLFVIILGFTVLQFRLLGSRVHYQ